MFFKTKFPTGKYSELNPDLIVHTMSQLKGRIEEMFPNAGLAKVADELQDIGQCIIRLVEELRRPLWTLRVLTVSAILCLIVFAVWLAVLAIRLSTSLQDGLMETLQGVESATNEVILLVIGIIFFATLENRIKRKKAFESLHRLRSIAHVVDMHQLTKDPNNLLSGTVTASSSPDRSMTPFELTRYLDYCTELLAITSKLAALHVQYFQDKEVLQIVNEVEMLAHELSNKIWQKIMILDITVPGVDKPEAVEEEGKKEDGES